MENGKKMYVTAEEAAEMLGVSTGYRQQGRYGGKVRGRTACGKNI